MSSPTRLLVIQTAFIGDVILATALLEHLHARFPETALDMLVRKGNEGLLEGHPFLNDLLVWDKRNGKYSSLWKLLKVVRQRQYDVIVNLQRFGATGLLTALSQASVTAGFDKNPFSRFYTYRTEHRILPGIHEVDRNAEVVRWLTKPNPSEHRPKLYPSRHDYQQIEAYKIGPYVCVAPTSVWFTKQYPAERWVVFLQQIPSDYTVYLLGAPSDARACEQIRNATGRANVVNLAGKLSLLASAALMEGAVMNYVNDSAPLHLASAMNAPTAAVFCSTVPQFGFGPLADDAHLIELDEPLECRPCSLHGRRKCPLGHFQCAHGIRTEQLLTVLETRPSGRV